MVADTILNTLRDQQGSVLIPVETVGRVFELLLALDARLTQLPYPLVFLSNLSAKTIEFIRVSLGQLFLFLFRFAFGHAPFLFRRANWSG